MLKFLKLHWCLFFHTSSRLTRPVNGFYRCMDCLQEFRVDWKGGK